MKPIKAFALLAFLLAPGLAAAQGYYGGGPGRQSQYSQPATGGFHQRQGRPTWGFSIGLGGIHDRGSNVTSCDNCDYNPIAFEGDAHIGGMLSERFALLAEFQVNAQTVHSDFYDGDTVLSQNVIMVAGQFWLTPQLWIKGGLGFAHLRADDEYFEYDLGNGGAIMGAVGYELFSARNFAVDLQGRLIQGSYDGLDDSITSGTVGVGLNWY